MASRGGALGVAVAVVGVVVGSFWLFRKSQSKKDLTKGATTPTGEQKTVKKSFVKDSRVSTPWGNGTVINFREEDQTYEVLLEVDEGATAKAYCQGDSLTSLEPKYSIGQIVSTPMGDGVVEAYRDEDKIYTIRHTFDDHGGARSHLAPQSVWPKLSKFNVGDLVQTPAGAGKVVGYSSADQIYEVDLKFDDHGGARAHLSEEVVENLRRPLYSLSRYIPGDSVQTPYGKGVVKSYREEDQIYEVALQFDDHGSACAFLPAEVIEASAPTFAVGDPVTTPQGTGVVHDIVFSDSGLSSPSYQVELDGQTREKNTFCGSQLAPLFPGVKHHALLREPQVTVEEEHAPILKHENGFIERESGRDQFHHVLAVAKGWLKSVGARAEDIRETHAAFAHYLNTFDQDEKLPETKEFLTESNRLTLAHVLNFFQKRYDGYHPGLASVAAYLLLFLSPSETLTYLSKIHTQPKYLPHGFTQKSLLPLVQVFASSIKSYFPEIDSHLQSQHILYEKILEKYVFTLNTDVLPFYSLFLFFTQYSHCGSSYLLQYSLSVTEKLNDDDEKKLLLKVKEPSILYSLFALDFNQSAHAAGYNDFESIATSWEILETKQIEKFSLDKFGIPTQHLLHHPHCPEPEWQEGDEEEDEEEEGEEGEGEGDE